ncbi:hypothetical protein AGLY_016810 [Aphis glycines]|uniref:DUF4806 domain-containing protein n=1 Tax=Aphis glycines TaxID=307491 RepID=A0A6G0SWR9_APHGL|nr:hypothetical protein AGLY_016810 [Aphis glycines]
MRARPTSKVGEVTFMSFISSDIFNILTIAFPLFTVDTVLLQYTSFVICCLFMYILLLSTTGSANAISTTVSVHGCNLKITELQCSLCKQRRCGKIVHFLRDYLVYRTSTTVLARHVRVSQIVVSSFIITYFITCTYIMATSFTIYTRGCTCARLRQCDYIVRLGWHQCVGTHSTYVLGYFEDENKYSVLPVNWLKKSKSNGIIKCLWPNYGVTTMTIMKGTKPSSKWTTHTVKLMEQFVSYDAAAAKNYRCLLRQGNNLLYSIGGSDCKHFVKRALIKLFTNKLATLCSWTGQKNNYRLVDHQIIKSLKTISRELYKNDENTFEICIKEWFRHVAQRLKKELINSVFILLKFHELLLLLIPLY